MKYYVYNGVCSWKDTFQLKNLPYIKIDMCEVKSLGYLPVYTSVETLREEYPNGDYFAVESQIKIKS